MSRSPVDIAEPNARAPQRERHTRGLSVPTDHDRLALLRTNNAVSEFVISGILSGRIAPGEKLPTERDLTARFNIPRNAVRDSLMILEAAGVIERKVGRGTFVSVEMQPNTLWSSMQPLDCSPVQLIEARLTIEPSMVVVVTKNATGGDLDAIAQWHHHCREAATLDEFHHCDRALHRAIGRATHNNLLVDTMERIDRARDNAEWDKLKGRRHQQRPDRRKAVEQEHGEVVKALLARDADSAHQAMVNHLLKVRLNLLGY